MANPKYHWAILVSDPSKHRHAWKAYAGGHYIQACGRKKKSAVGYSAERFAAKVQRNPDWYCSDCAKAARLALAKESAPEVVVYQEPRPVYTPGQSTGFGPVVSVRPLVTHDPSKCAQKPIAPATESAPKQSDIVITQNWLGPDKPEGARTSAPRYRAGQAAIGSTWPKPRPISEAPKDGSMVLIRLPDCNPQWTIGVFDPRRRWVDRLATAIVEPTHFLPLPPEVR